MPNATLHPTTPVPDLLTITHAHGTLTLEAVTPVRPVAGLYAKDLPADWLFHGMETGEQLAVLCEAHPRIQIAFAYPLLPGHPGYLFAHHSAGTGRVMRITAMEYHGPDARQVIQDAHDRQRGWHALR